MAHLKDLLVTFALTSLVGYAVGTAVRGRSTGRRVGLGLGVASAAVVHVGGRLRDADALAETESLGSEPVDIEVEKPS